MFCYRHKWKVLVNCTRPFFLRPSESNASHDSFIVLKQLVLSRCKYETQNYIGTENSRQAAGSRSSSRHTLKSLDTML
jgi:hypothetical protein